MQRAQKQDLLYFGLFDFSSYVGIFEKFRVLSQTNTFNIEDPLGFFS